MPEQAPKFICEICDGFHPTAEHERATKKTETPKQETTPSEFEPSPEIIEKIMQKVTDIEEDGTAYHVMTEPQELPGSDQDKRPWQERLEDIFRYGLLGTARSERNGIAAKISPQQWIEHARKEKRGEVMFNIVGRTFSADRLAQQDWEGARAAGKKWIEWDIYMWQPGNKVAVVFDLARFQEVEPRKGEHLGLPRHKTFHADSPVTKTDDNGRVMAERSYGFSLYPRVPQHEFLGVVFKAARRYTAEEIKNILKTGGSEYRRRAFENSWVEDDDSKVLEQRAEEIVALMKKIYKDRPNSMVPVYDAHGNLYWPKKMSYGEVKEFTQRRVQTIKQKNRDGEK